MTVPLVILAICSLVGRGLLRLDRRRSPTFWHTRRRWPSHRWRPRLRTANIASDAHHTGERRRHRDRPGRHRAGGVPVPGRSRRWSSKLQAAARAAVLAVVRQVLLRSDLLRACSSGRWSCWRELSYWFDRNVIDGLVNFVGRVPPCGRQRLAAAADRAGAVLCAGDGAGACWC